MVLDKLNSENPDEEMDACLMLGRLRDAEAVPLLKEKLRNNSMLVRHSAANALARIGGAEVVAIFKEMVASTSEEKKRIGLAGLAMTGDPGSIELVAAQLDDPNWQVRWSAVYALGQWGYRPVLSKLEEIAKSDPYKNSADGEYTIRQMAVDACNKIKCSFEWYRSLNDAKLLAEKLGKPVWAYFYIQDNALCSQMEDGVLFSVEMSDLSQHFVCVKLDAQKEHGLVAQYDISVVPYNVVFDKSGNEIDRIAGLLPRKELISRLNKVLENKGTPKEWKEKIASNERDVESLWHLAEWYLDNGKTKDAFILLENVVKYDEKNQFGYTDDALFALGFSYGSIGEYKKAIGMLEDLKARYPSFKYMDKAMYCLGLAYLSLNKVDSARKTFGDLVAVYPESKAVNPARELLDKIKE